MPDKRPALGRGLSALIPDIPQANSPSSTSVTNEVDLDLLQPNEDQPRRSIDETKLEELAQSIRGSGVIQPIIVRPKETGKYEIVAGERRWRAAQKAGLLKVPVVVREVDDNRRLELALIENIQRENLNPLEEAKAYKQLSEQLTQEEISSVVGKDRATVANYQRLLALPIEVQNDLAAGGLSMGHARALLSLTDPAIQRRLARDIQSRVLSVRDTELLVKSILSPKPTRLSTKEPDVHTRAAEERLRVVLGTRVQIKRKVRGGRIEIQFTSDDELQRLFEQLTAQ